MLLERDTQKQRPLDLAPVVAQIIDKMNLAEMLYYGRGEDFWETFRPSHPLTIEAFSETLVGGERPGPSSFVVSVDYLHSVGMLRISDILDELKRITRGIGFFHVRTHSEVEELRTIDKPISWWLQEFVKRFDLQTFQKVPEGFYVIVFPRTH
jgi:hypothetical protein